MVRIEIYFQPVEDIGIDEQVQSFPLFGTADELNDFIQSLENNQNNSIKQYAYKRMYGLAPNGYDIVGFTQDSVAIGECEIKVRN